VIAESQRFLYNFQAHLVCHIGLLIMQTGERYSKLLELARENSSEKRRELLGDVTDMFFASQNDRSDVEATLFGDLMAKVAYELDVEVRKDLSARFVEVSAPRSLAFALAHDDEVAVAAPILRNSTTLTQDDLISVVQRRGDAHRLVITKRPDVTEALSAALVAHGDDKVVASLINNETAQVAPDTFDVIVDRAQSSRMLHNPLVSRRAIPPEHLNRLYMSVDATLRARILERNAQLTEAELNASIERAKVRVAVSNGALPDDFEAASESVKLAKNTKTLTPQSLPRLWRDKEMTRFFLSFAELTGLDYHRVFHIFEQKDLDGIAMISRASGFDRALFVTLAVLILGEQGMGQAKTLGDMYNDVPVEAAQRALRFMKLRASTLSQAA
jgi:uncharacterized protein (DUF2336 family)